MKTLADYQELLKDRPFKWTDKDVAYRDADSFDMRCERCFHFYERRKDRFSVCEIMRSGKTDQVGVNPDYVCDFFSPDGNKFPLIKGEEEK